METNYPVLCSSKPLKPDLEKFQRIPITSDVFKLGRGQSNTVVMPYKCFSKDHCIFKKVDEDWILENCSYSSIKINGNKVRKGQKRKLLDQDVIKLENSSEFVYTFNKNSLRKRRKLDDQENVKKKESRKTSSERMKEQIVSEQSRKEKQIYNEYATRIENLKGSKKAVKRQKSLLKIRRDTQLKALRIEMESKMASLPENQQNCPDLSEAPKDLLTQSRHSEVRQESPKQEALYRLRAKIREQDRLRLREKKELRKLRKETEQLRLDKEKKLKEIEKQKLARERELQDELNKLNKKLAKQIELHESEKRRHEQLLKQKKKKEHPSPEDPRSDMEAELQCSICSELFVRAATLGCAHSFCQYCVRKWQQSRQDCPMCRAPITSECRSIVLDSLVEKMVDSSEEGRRQRQELLKTREELEAKEAAAAARRVTENSYRVYEITEYMREYENDEYEINENDNSDTNSSYYERESSLEPDPELLVTDSDSNEGSIDFSVSDENYERESSPEFVESENETSPENYEEHDENSPENYEEHDENESPPENDGETDGERDANATTPEYYDDEADNSREEHENYELDGENYEPDVENDGEDAPSESDHDDPDYNEVVSSPEDGEIEYDAGDWEENDYDGDNSCPEPDDDDTDYEYAQ